MMRSYILEEMNELPRARRAFIEVIDLADGASNIAYPTTIDDSPLGQAISAAFASGESSLAEVSSASFFLNVFRPAKRVALIGAVHIAQALASILEVVGLEVIVIDPRTAFATAQRFGNATVVPLWPDEAFQEQALDQNTALVALTHDAKIDDQALIAALDARCFYVGALGSRKTAASRVTRLTAAGIQPDRLDSICAPVGLDIGARSPPEIAVSIAAEIIRHSRTKSLRENA
jgi:xanthine dehydrogenase accessory factor